MFMGAFLNGTKIKQFNESLSYKPTLSLLDIVTITECYIKGEYNNINKKVRDVKKRVPTADGPYH